MRKAWEHADRCEAQGSRLLRIKLKLNKRVLNVISVYATTFKMEVAQKDRFYDQLNPMLGHIGSQAEVHFQGL